jgi:hypothetical protein
LKRFALRRPKQAAAIKGVFMDLTQLSQVLDELEPGMSIAIPKDWFSVHVNGADETERDVRTIDLAVQRDCTWERNPETQLLTFVKQPSKSK